MNLQAGPNKNRTDNSHKHQALADALEKFLTGKINELSLEGESNTPDFIMAHFLRSICMKAYHAANELINIRFMHTHGLAGVIEINDSSPSPLWIPSGQQPVYTRETVGVQADWATHDDYIIALALAGDETAMHNAAGCGFGRITKGKFVADEPPQRNPAKAAERVDRITTEGLQKVWDRLKAVRPSEDSAVEKWVFDNFKYVSRSNEQLNIDKGDEEFELARSLHRSIRAMHDGNCPACGIIRPSTEFEHWLMVGNEKKLNHKCPQCGEYITWQDAEAGLAMFHKFMRRNWERFKKWVADRRNVNFESPQPTTLKYQEATHRIDVTMCVTDELIAEPKAFREWCHTELRHKLDDFLSERGQKEQPPYSAPFTTDVPNCCGDPAKCDTPCQPAPAGCQHEWIIEASTYCKKCGIRPEMESDNTWKISHYTVFERDGDSYEAYKVFNTELDKAFNCDGKADAEWLANELNWRKRSINGLGQSYRVAYGAGTEIEPEAVAFVLRLDGEVRDRLHLQACWRAAMAFVEHYKFYSNGNLPSVPAALEKYLQENGRKLHEKVTTQPRAVFHQ